jgi:hypothetical protein
MPGLARKIRVLDALSWPDGVEETFLANWRAGKAALPDVELRPRDHSADITALEAFTERCDVGHPAGNHLAMTARSYATAGRMLGAVGTPAFTGYSSALYRRPDFYYHRLKLSMLDAARFFLNTTDALLGGARIPPSPAEIPAELFTGSMGINRLRRLVLRVLAVQQALEGADFIQVFEGCLAAGQSQEESFRSTQRVFRGANRRGGSAFTKDAAYLTGLLGVHTLLRIAIRDNRPELVAHL